MIEIFSERFNALMNARGLTQSRISEDLNVNRSTINRYCKGAAFPQPEMLKTLAEYFNVSTDYLIGNTNSYIADPIMDAKITAAMQKIKNETPERQEQILSLLQGMLKL